MITAKFKIVDEDGNEVNDPFVNECNTEVHKAIKNAYISTVADHMDKIVDSREVPNPAGVFIGAYTALLEIAIMHSSDGEEGKEMLDRVMQELSEQCGLAKHSDFASAEEAEDYARKQAENNFKLRETKGNA